MVLVCKVGPGYHLLLGICNHAHIRFDTVHTVRKSNLVGNVMGFLRGEIVNVGHHLVQPGVAHLSQSRCETVHSRTIAKNVKKFLERVRFRLRAVEEKLDGKFELLDRWSLPAAKEGAIGERTSSSP
jgi:hypothetical protein